MFEAITCAISRRFRPVHGCALAALGSDELIIGPATGILDCCARAVTGEPVTAFPQPQMAAGANHHIGAQCNIPALMGTRH